MIRRPLVILGLLGTLLLAGCGVPAGQGYIACQYHRGVDDFPDEPVFGPGVGRTVLCKDGRVFHIEEPK